MITSYDSFKEKTHNTNINDIDFTAYMHITNDYNIEIENRKTMNKKIKYNNPENIKKNLLISSTIPHVLYIKNENIQLDYKSSKYIKISISSPSTIGMYIVYIVIQKENNKGYEIEEILKFHIKVY